MRPGRVVSAPRSYLEICVSPGCAEDASDAWKEFLAVKDQWMGELCRPVLNRVQRLGHRYALAAQDDGTDRKPYVFLHQVGTVNGAW